MDTDSRVDFHGDFKVGTTYSHFKGIPEAVRDSQVEIK